jgi:hypothetical protein
MHALLSTSAMILPLLTSVYASKGAGVENSKRYVSLSRFTDPKDLAALLDDLPDDVRGILRVVKRQIIHPDLVARFGISDDERRKMRKVWPPRLADILKALKDAAPQNLRDGRKPGQRVVGACILRSYFIAGLLRYRLIPARVRAGYLKDASPGALPPNDSQAQVKRDRASKEAAEVADEKKEWDSAASMGQSIKINRYTEHWTCECWDAKKMCWELLDTDDPMPERRRRAAKPACRQFEYASEAWKKMRRGEKMFIDESEEELSDLRSQIRSQLLWDFASLLNHDLAGCGEPSGNTQKFFEEKKYSELSSRELLELDQLAELLSRTPAVDELVAFYHKSPTMRIESAENDPYSYVYR